MFVQLEIFSRPISTDSPNAISLPGLADGFSLSKSPDGRPHGKSGRHPAPASHSATPGSNWGIKTRATYGRCFGVWLAGASLQSSLESKLRRRLDVNGSLEYALTWRAWDMRLGPQICALRASAHRTSGKDFTGWRSPDNNRRGGAYGDPEKALARITSGHQVNLEDQTMGLVGWASPTCAGGAGETSEDLERVGNKWINRKTGRVLQTNLATDVKMLVGWCSPTAQDHSRGGKPPRPTDTGIPLSQQAAMVSGWGTPTARDHKDGSSTGGGTSELFARKNGAWGDFDIIHCKDGKARRVESSTFPMVDGISKGVVHRRDPGAPIDPQATPEARVMRLRGYGNAIVPPLAAEFIRTVMEIID